jgi:hypothetical protein
VVDAILQSHCRSPLEDEGNELENLEERKKKSFPMDNFLIQNIQPYNLYIQVGRQFFCVIDEVKYVQCPGHHIFKAQNNPVIA